MAILPFKKEEKMHFPISFVLCLVYYCHQDHETFEFHQLIIQHIIGLLQFMIIFGDQYKNGSLWLTANNQLAG